MRRWLVTLILLVPVFSTDTVRSMPISQAIADQMRSLYGLDSTTCTIEIISNPLTSRDVAPSDFLLQPLTRSQPRGLFTVMGTVSSGGQKIESRQIRLRVSYYADVIVMSDNAPRGSILDSTTCHLERKEITNLRERPVTSLDELTGRRARRHLCQGDVVTVHDFEPIPDIVSGKEVTIVFEQGLCRIAAPGRVLQSGSIGDYVKVRNQATRKTIVARVLDAATVAVDP